MRVLVTGGFGFIGGHLIERLLRDEHEVVVVDDCRSNPVPVSDLLEEIGDISQLRYHIETISNFLETTYYVQYFPMCFDQIYHLASPVGAVGVLPYAGRLVPEVVRDGEQLIRFARGMAAKLLDVSTSEVYGGGVDGLCREDMPRIIQPETTVRLEYAVAKLAVETMLVNSCRVRGLRACIVRPFNVAGPRQTWITGFVIPRFISQALSGEPLTIFGTGQQVRAFTHVVEIVDALVRCMEQGGEVGEVYNLGNGKNLVTIQDLAELVLKVSRSGSEIVYVDPRDEFGPLYAEAADKYADESAAVHLGWTPAIGLEQIIEDAVSDHLHRFGHRSCIERTGVCVR